MTLLLNLVVVGDLFSLLKLDMEELFKGSPLEEKEFEELALICGHITEERVPVILLNHKAAKIVACDYSLKLDNHRFRMSLSIPQIGIDIVYIIIVPISIHLHRLEE